MSAVASEDPANDAIEAILRRPGREWSEDELNQVLAWLMANLALPLVSARRRLRIKLPAWVDENIAQEAEHVVMDKVEDIWRFARSYDPTRYTRRTEFRAWGKRAFMNWVGIAVSRAATKAGEKWARLQGPHPPQGPVAGPLPRKPGPRIPDWPVSVEPSLPLLSPADRHILVLCSGALTAADPRPRLEIYEEVGRSFTPPVKGNAVKTRVCRALKALARIPGAFGSDPEGSLP